MSFAWGCRLRPAFAALQVAESGDCECALPRARPGARKLICGLHMHPVVYIYAVRNGRLALWTGRALPHFRGMISGAPAEPNIGASSTDNKSGFQTAYNQREIIRAPCSILQDAIWLKLLLQAWPPHRPTGHVGGTRVACRRLIYQASQCMRS